MSHTILPDFDIKEHKLHI